MAKLDGIVIEALPDARFGVRLDAGHEIVAYTGTVKETLTGDRVNNKMSPTISRGDD
jgi:translation initiation factor IF-1